MILLKNTDSKVNAVVHVADIHIRLTKRHDEYLNVFTKFYQALEKVQKLNAVLVIAGDVFHNKSDLRDRKSTRLNSSHVSESRMPSSA